MQPLQCRRRNRKIRRVVATAAQFELWGWQNSTFGCIRYQASMFHRFCWRQPVCSCHWYSRAGCRSVCYMHYYQLPNNRDTSVFSFTLTTWHRQLLLSAGRAAIDRYLLPAGPTATNLQLQQWDSCCGPMLGQRDGHCTITQTWLCILCVQCQ